jgi:hypothetical protein
MLFIVDNDPDVVVDDSGMVHWALSLFIGKVIFIEFLRKLKYESYLPATRGPNRGDLNLHVHVNPNLHC